MKNTKHTPTPWRIQFNTAADETAEDAPVGYEIHTARADHPNTATTPVEVIAYDWQGVSGLRMTDAAFILLAANNHDKLVELAEMVASGNSEITRLEQTAAELLASIRKEQQV